MIRLILIITGLLLAALIFAYLQEVSRKAMKNGEKLPKLFDD